MPSLRVALATLLPAALACGGCVSGTGDAGRGLSADAIERLKSATALVRADAGPWQGSATLFRVDGETGYLLAWSQPFQRSGPIRVFFDAGTSLQRSYEGTVLSVDPGRELACLRVNGKGLPQPLELGEDLGVSETAEVFAAVYSPWGSSLPPTGPAIWIPRLSVTSLTRGAGGEVTRLRLSGDVPQGASGGPVVGSDLKVRGILGQQLPGAAGAVACGEFSGFLRGHLRDLKVEVSPATDEKVKLEIEARVSDPMSEFHAAGIAWTRKDHTGGATAETGLEVARATGVARATVELSAGPGDGIVIYAFQPWWTLKDGTRVQGAPLDVAVDFGNEEAPEAEKLPELQTGDTIRPISRLSKQTSLQGLWLMRDRASLCVLNLSDGRVLRVRASDLAVTGGVDVSGGVVAMTLDPAESMLFVAARDLEMRDVDGHFGGLVHVIRLSDLQLLRTLKFAGDPGSIAATDAGVIAVGTRGQRPGVFVLDSAGKEPALKALSSCTGWFVRLHPRQVRIYAGNSGVSPGDFFCVHLRQAAGATGDLFSYDSPYHGQLELGGDCAISPDGRFLAGNGGPVLGLARRRDADLLKVAATERWTAAAFVPSKGSFFIATPEGFLKQYSSPGFELRKSWKTGELCLELAVDPETARIFALIDSSPAGQRRSEDWNRPLTDIRSWSIEAK
ncbi:MAG: trypsin-like peptidase domain-containing protein [Planctomycetota bacterium]|mgnify:CR=1 FL=1